MKRSFMSVTFPAILPLLLLVSAGCDDDDDSGDSGNLCNTVTLPLSGDLNGPVVEEVGLEVQGSGIVIVATATDPQGTDNLLNVQQSIGVYRDKDCENDTPIVLEDDLAGSGLEETFGTAVVAATDPALYGEIAAAESWPVSVLFRDQDGNETSGRVMAEVRQ